MTCIPVSDMELEQKTGTYSWVWRNRKLGAAAEGDEIWAETKEKKKKQGDGTE